MGVFLTTYSECLHLLMPQYAINNVYAYTHMCVSAYVHMYVYYAG